MLFKKKFLSNGQRNGISFIPQTIRLTDHHWMNNGKVAFSIKNSYEIDTKLQLLEKNHFLLYLTSLKYQVRSTKVLQKLLLKHFSLQFFPFGSYFNIWNAHNRAHEYKQHLPPSKIYFCHSEKCAPPFATACNLTVQYHIFILSFVVSLSPLQFAQFSKNHSLCSNST